MEYGFLIPLGILVFAVVAGCWLAKGDEQNTYNKLKGNKLAYEAAITAPLIEEKPWVPIYKQCGCTSRLARMFCW